MSRSFDIGRLFTLHRDELQRFALRRLGDRDRAADVVQDTFVRLANAVNESNPLLDNPRAYLFRITGNLATDALRHSRVADAVLDREGLNDSLPAAQPTPETVALDRDLLRRLQAALALLPDGQRRVLTLKRLHGCSHAEIGARTGLSPAAVEKNLTRALQRLRAVLGEDWP